MTPEQRREQAEKEVREKLEKVPLAGIPTSELQAAKEEAIAAYNLAVSQTIALAEAQERIAELEKALGSVLAVKRARECKHDEEWGYCDSCLYDYQLELGAALTEARAALKGE